MTNANWIPISTRKPTEADAHKISKHVMMQDSQGYECSRHWKSDLVQGLCVEPALNAIAWQPLPPAYVPEVEQQYRDAVMPDDYGKEAEFSDFPDFTKVFKGRIVGCIDEVSRCWISFDATRGADTHKFCRIPVDAQPTDAQGEKEPSVPAPAVDTQCDCTKYNGGQCFNCLNGRHSKCDSGRGVCNKTPAPSSERGEGERRWPDNAPDWAVCCVLNPSGREYFCSCKPQKFFAGWKNPGNWEATDRRFVDLADKWEQSLIERPTILLTPTNSPTRITPTREHLANGPVKCWVRNSQFIPWHLATLVEVKDGEFVTELGGHKTYWIECEIEVPALVESDVK